MNTINIINNKQDIFCMYVCVPAGSIYETKKTAGISHVLEHMLLKRTKKYTEEVLIDKLAKLGGVSNASTDKDVTCYYIYTVAENWEKSIDILTSVIRHPEFDKDELELEKKIILEEINMRKDQNSKLMNLSLESVLCKKNIYRSLIEGTVENVKRFTIQDLMSYYKRFYKDYIITINCPKRLERDVFTKLEHGFCKNKIVNFDNEKDRKLSTCFDNMIYIVKKDRKQYTHTLTFLSFPRSEIKKNIVLNFLRFALINGTFKSKFIDVLRTKLGLVYSINSSNYTYRYIGLFDIELSTTTNNIVHIIKIIIKLINDIHEQGMTKSDLDYFKTAFLNSRKLVFANEHFRTIWYAEKYFYNNTVTEDQYVKHIKDITNDDIMEVSKEVLDVTKMGLLTYGRYNKTKPLIDDIKGCLLD